MCATNVVALIEELSGVLKKKKKKEKKRKEETMKIEWESLKEKYWRLTDNFSDYHICIKWVSKQ